LLYLRKVLSEYPYSTYKNNFIFRLKTAIKIFLVKNKKNKKIDYINYKYIFYVNGYGHYLRALEFKKSILKKVKNDHVLMVINTNDKKIINSLSVDSKHMIKFGVTLKKSEYRQMIYCLFIFVFLNKFKCLLNALTIYKKGVSNYFKNNDHIVNKYNINLISFNDQPIDISILESIFKEHHIVKKSIVYQHGIIGAHQFYFPSKSDYFYGYSKNNDVINYFQAHNRYNTKFYDVGNLKYQKKYQKVIKRESRQAALIILTPGWNFFLKTIKTINKNERKSYKYFLRFHPSMKLLNLAKILTRFYGLPVDENPEVSFETFDIVITEVSTVGLEALSEGVPIAILTDLNYEIPYYFHSKHIPKIKAINQDTLKYAINLSCKNKEEILILLKEYFG